MKAMVIGFAAAVLIAAVAAVALDRVPNTTGTTQVPPSVRL
ncbi:hypothetical protein [Azospirillum halopraeferens]|nr:hypothetical protein [Azospirillum halopraeferens]